MDEVSEEVICVNCQSCIDENWRFCKSCGAAITIKAEAQEVHARKWLWIATVFFLIDLVLCLISKFTETLHNLLILDAIFTVEALGFAVYMWPQLKHVFSIRKISVLKLLAYCLIAVAASCAVQVSVGWLNQSLIGYDEYYQTLFTETEHPFIYMLLVIALQPAVVEELAYRGIIYSSLNRFLDDKQSLFIAAFAFALIHLSFISFFWLLPFALWLGYIRMKENTIWYGVIIHLVFNATAVFSEYFDLL